MIQMSNYISLIDLNKDPFRLSGLQVRTLNVIEEDLDCYVACLQCNENRRLNIVPMIQIDVIVNDI